MFDSDSCVWLFHVKLMYNYMLAYILIKTYILVYKYKYTT